MKKLLRNINLPLVTCLIAISLLLGIFLGSLENDNELNQTFYASIDEIDENHLLVSGLDVNDINFRSKFSFNISDNTILEWRYTSIDISDFEIGDIISITFSGEILESYPAQIRNVLRVQLLSDKYN